MGQEDKKVIELFTLHGLQMNILTRMPVKEIHAEILGGDERDSLFIVLEGINDIDDHIEVRICRDHLSAYVIKPATKSQIARVAPQIVQ